MSLKAIKNTFVHSDYGHGLLKNTAQLNRKKKH